MSLGVSSAMAQIPYGQGEMVSIAPIVISAQEEFAKLQAQYAAGASKDVTTSIFNLRPMPGSSTVNGVPTHWLFDGLRVWSDGRRYSWSSGLTHTSRCPRAERGASIIENTKNVRVNDVVVGFELECLLSYSKKVNPRDHVCRANDLNYFTPNPVFLPTGEKIRNDVDYQDNGQDSLTLSRSYRAWSDGGGTKFNFQPKTLVIARSAEIVRDASWITWSPGFYPQTSSYERSHYGKSIFAEYNGDGYIFSNSDGDRRTFKSNVLKMVSISEEDQPGGVATVYRLDDAEADTAEYYEEAGSTGEDAQVRKYYRIIKKRAGKSWYYFDYIDGAKIHVKNRFGRILEINHLNGRVDSVVAPDGAVYSYKYDLKQNLTSVHYPDGEVRSYHYQENTGLMTGIDINEDVYERYYYDDSGRVKRTEFSGGVGAWDIQVLNNSAFVADPVGTQRSHSFGFLGGSFSTSVSPYVHSDGNVIAAKSSGKSGLLESLRTFGSENRKITWDETRRLPLQFKLADGNAASQTKSIDWHPESRWPVRITESGPQGGQRVTELAYDSHGNLLNEKITGTGLDQPVARNWSYTDKDLLASEVDENGAAVSYTYDQWGNRKSRTNALGQVTAYVHDASGRLLGQTDPNGISHSYTYDARGRLLTQSANGLTTTMGYHPSGLLASMAVASGYRMEFNYDAAHRLTGWQDNRGNRGSYVLDGIGNRITEELRGANGGLAFTIQRTINAINRIASQKVGDDKRTSYKYDANGDLIEITNGLNQATSFTLDRLRRLTGVADPRNAKTLLAYNALDALTQAADFKGVATDYASDAQGNVKQEVSPDAGKSTASYDRRGQLVSNTDAAGRTLTVQRDALDRPTQLQYGSTATSTLRYDLPGTTYNGPGAPKASTGHLSEIQDPGVTTQYQRDILGRVLRKSQILANGDTRSLIHAYVPAGQGGAGSLQSITYPSGKQATYLYDSTGQITGLQWNGQPLVTGLAWSPLGQPTAWQWQGFAQQPGATAALAEQRSYSTAGQLASSTLLNLTWDAAGRISLIQQQHMLPGREEFVIA
jgi:YD repeat-containing protein